MPGIVLSTIAFTVYCCLGIYVLGRDRESPQHRNFFYFCMCFALWSFGYIMIGVSTGNRAGDLWQRVAYMGALSYEVFVLRFFLLFTGVVKNFNTRKGLSAALWVVPAVFMYMNCAHNAVTEGFPDGFWYVGIHVFANSYNMASILLIVIWARRTRLKREKKQAGLIIGGGIPTMLATLAADYLLGYLHIPTISPFLILGWILCLLFAMVRYRFLSLTPEMISSEIISRTDDLVILLGNDGKLFFSNPAATQLLGGGSITGEDPGTFFVESARLERETAMIVKGTLESFSARAHLRRDGEDPLPVDLRYSTIKDEFGDPLGILVIGKVVKGIVLIKSLYRITAREIEIIEHLISGNPNHLIAESLSISLNTLKAHITNIYNKLGVGNKVELINLLGEFNLVPDMSAKRRLLLKN